MKLRKWVKVTLAIMLVILLGKVIYNLITIRTVKHERNSTIVCNGKWIKVCSSNNKYDI